MLGNRYAVRIGFAFSLFIAWAAPVHAQVVAGNQWPTPRLNFISPSGAKIGTSVEVTFNGTEVEEPTALLFSHPGIKGVPIIPPLPPVDPKVKPDPKKEVVRPPVTKLTITVGKEVPVGRYDVRLVNKNGISNPRVFVVGNLIEVEEKEPNNEDDKPQKVAIGSTINGTIAAGTDVDFYSFVGKKGQRVLITCQAASMDSRLEPELHVFNPKGIEVGAYRPKPGEDGLVDVTLAEDGEFLVRLHHFTYLGGGAEHFYRLSISTDPYIDAIFPTMIQPGMTAPITLYGRNLPGGKLDPTAVVNGIILEKLTVNVAAPTDADQMKYTGLVPPLVGTIDGFEYRLTGPTGVSNPVLITYARGPVVHEVDANDTPETAQIVPVPCEIAGRVDKKRDRDWYVFDAKKGDVWIIDVFSHRLNAPTDMYFVLKSIALKQDIVLQEDNPDNHSQRYFTASNRDPAPYRFVAPADGKFHLMLASHFGDNYADPTHVYQVRITKERPDFRLFVMPSDDARPDSCIVTKGGSQNYTVYAQRMDGFKGEILLTIEGLPAGVTCAPQYMGSTMRLAQLVVTAADGAADFAGAVKVVGTSVANGQKIVHTARPATVTWGVPLPPAFPTITRLNQELVLAVREKTPAKFVAVKDKVVVSLGDKIDIPLKLTRTAADFKTPFQVAPVPGELPAGLAFANLTFAPGKDDLNAVLTVATNAVPGNYSIAFRGFAPISPNPKAKPVNTILISTPVHVTILPKQVATLTVDPASPTIKVGATGVLAVRVARLHDFNDPFKVSLVLPPNVKGVSAPDIVIPAGAGEAKMTLTVAAGTPPANLQNLTVRATAIVNGNVTLTHEIKINVIVAK